MLNAMTIDVEDYYHVSAFESIIRFEDWEKYESRVGNNIKKILLILDEYNVKATFFVLGWIAEHYPEIVEEIQNRGHEVASHGYRHQLIYTQTPEIFEEDVSRSKEIIEDITKKPIEGYRAPSYSITQNSLWALDILAKIGLKYDSSIFPIRHPVYGIPDFKRFPHIANGNGRKGILEFPLSTGRLFGRNIPIAGGGYIRYFPCSFLHWAIQRINQKEKMPAIIYFHPWEIDPCQPKQPVKLMTRLRHYHNLDKMEGKIRRLLSDFQFGTIKKVLNL